MTEEKIERLPCPFCGSKETQIFENAYDGMHYFVSCCDCEASSCHWAESEEEAVEMWNRRWDLSREIL